VNRTKNVNQSLLDDLKKVLPDQITDSLFDRVSIANDASHYLLTPTMVAKPKTAQQISEIFKITQKHDLGITFRSGGTSLSGQSVTDSLLVDTRKNFKEIEVLENGLKVRVQPGLTVNRVNASLRKYGRKLGPDPASEIACTIGGVIANNSSGMACGTEFNTYKTLSSLVFVLPSGTLIDSSKNDADEQLRIKEPEIYAGLIALRNRIVEKPQLVEKIKNAYSIKNTMGYGLNSFVDFEKPIDILTHLIVGSEGTLAFIAEATFNTLPLLSKSATSLLIFDELELATKSLPTLKNSDAAVIELLDISSLKVAQREHMADTVLKDYEFKNHAGLLIEYEADTESQLDSLINNAHQVFKDLPIKSGELTKSVEIRNELWHARKGLYAAVAGNRPSGTTALLEDISVPMKHLHETTTHLSELLKKHRYLDSVIFGHAKDGNLHFLLNEKFHDPTSLQRYEDFTEDMVELVLSHDGSLKAEHGTGRIMAPYVKRQFGAELYQIMVDLKRLIDNRNILNPGIIINENENIHIENLKVSPVIDQEVDKCVECGYCETVCPSKDLTLTPRQRITIRRVKKDAERNNDQELLDAINANYDYQAIDTCAVDGMCATACPVHINTGDLVKRLRSEQQSFVSQSLASLAASKWSATTNLLSGLLTTAKNMPAPIVETVNKVLRSISGENSMPMWNKTLPIGGKERSSLKSNNPDLVYFPSCVNSLYGESDIQKAFLNLCEKAGLNVLIPEGIQDLCCGTPWASKGLTQGYEVMALKTKKEIMRQVKRENLVVVSDATSCTHGLIQIFGETQIPVVDVLQFVNEKILPNLKVKTKLSSLALHPTCSGVELGINKHMTSLAAAISEQVIVPLDWSCCGFAGDRGLLHPELTESATKNQAQELSSHKYVAYASSNRPCQIGLSIATGQNYVHLVELVDQVS
jgi:D-lactate dehydrogenase